MDISKFGVKAIVGLTIGILIGFLSSLYTNVLIGVFTLVTWLILMFGYPKEKGDIWKLVFWISATGLPSSWAVFLLLR